MVTMKQMCETIVRAELCLKRDGTKPTALEIYNSSPTGELSQVFAWYGKAKKILDGKEGEEL